MWVTVLCLGFAGVFLVSVLLVFLLFWESFCCSVVVVVEAVSFFTLLSATVSCFLFALLLSCVVAVSVAAVAVS